MGTKGYRNIAKSGVKAATAKREQTVAKQRTRRKPRDRCGPPAISGRPGPKRSP